MDKRLEPAGEVVLMWIFDPFLPRSTGFGPVRSPLWPPAALTESIAHRDQSSSPREPSASSGIRYSLAHTRAALHSANRRCTVCQDAPKIGGNCRQVHLGGGHKDDRRQDQVWSSAPPPSTPLRPCRRGRHHPLEQLPQLIGNQSIHECHDQTNDSQPNKTRSKRGRTVVGVFRRRSPCAHDFPASTSGDNG